MKDPAKYFILGLAVAAAIGLIGLVILNAQLFNTFVHFSGN